MKRSAKFTSIIAIGIVVMIGCKKEQDLTPQTPTTSNSSTSSMGSFFKQYGAPSQSFTINSTQYNLISGSKGTKIYIPANSFVKQNNQTVTGNVTIELKEIFSKKDMILSGAPTTSNKQLLISGGELYLKVTKDGETLKLANSSSVYIDVPAGNTPSFQMQEFYTSNLSVTDTTGEWTPATDTTTITVGQDTTGGSWGNYYQFELDSVNWINCDYFWNSTATKTDISVTVGNDFDHTNCVVYMSVDGINSVASLYEYIPAHVYNGYNMPIGTAVTFVAIAEINGQYYSAFASTTISNNHSQTLTLQTTTLSQIQTQLSTLP